MKSLRKLCAAAVLSSLLGICAVAQIPCAPPIPGEVQTPPCAIAQVQTPEESVPSDTAEAVQGTENGDISLVTDIALEVLRSMLPLL